MEHVTTDQSASQMDNLFSYHKRFFLAENVRTISIELSQHRQYGIPPCTVYELLFERGSNVILQTNSENLARILKQAFSNFNSVPIECRNALEELLASLGNIQLPNPIEHHDNDSNQIC